MLLVDALKKLKPLNKVRKDDRTGYVDSYRNEKGDIQRWAENQTFIALGQMLLAAGIEGIDARRQLVVLMKQF